MLNQSVSVHEVKAALLEFHEKKGYKIFESFPIVSNDPTVLFTNATITPFKHWFTDYSIKPHNYALIQQCVRIGGASELETIGVNPYYFSYFEMFGSGTFGVKTEGVVSYLLELLDTVGITKERLYFTVPTYGDFIIALNENGIKNSKIFLLNNNDFFWQEWKFGEPGPVGHGLSVIFSRSSRKVSSIEELAANPEDFVELLNLIHIHSQTLPDKTLTSVPHPGFDLGMGIERIIAVLKGCNSYQIDTINPLVRVVHEFLIKKTRRLDVTTARISADHLRTSCVLLGKGLRPSNKRHGYVLRKLIRRFLELIWISTDSITATEVLVEDFVTVMGQCDQLTAVPISIVTESICNEERALKSVLQKARDIIQKQPMTSLRKLRDTYGLPPSLIKFLQQNRKGDNDETH